MKYPFKSLLLAATVLAAASCAKDDTQSGGEETAGPVIVNASPAAIGGEIILKLKTEASGIVEKSRAQGVSKGSGIDEIDRILNTVNTVRFERLFPDGGRFEERTRREGLHLWYYAKYDPSIGILPLIPFGPTSVSVLKHTSSTPSSPCIMEDPVTTVSEDASRVLQS